MINDLDGSPQILRNEITAIGNWLKVRLAGANRCNRRRCRRSRREHRAAPARKSGSSYISQEDACSSAWERRGRPIRFR